MESPSVTPAQRRGNTGAANDGNPCAQPAKLLDDTCKSKGGLIVGEVPICADPSHAPYYRVIVRTVGGRNTVSYTETIVH